MSNATRTRTADEGVARPAGSEPCLFLVFACDRPSDPMVRCPLGAFTQVTIGRGTSGFVADKSTLAIALPDAWMSSRHVKLEGVLGRWVLEDLGSKNGTRVAGEIGQRFFLYREAVPRGDRAPVTRGLDAGAPRFDCRERLGAGEARFLPASVRALIALQLDDADGLERCLRAALTAAAGAPIGPSHVKPPATIDKPRFTCEGELWTIRFAGDEVRLKDSDGVRYLTHLVERPAVEVRATDLLALTRRTELREEGDAGALLDGDAKRAYKRRLEDLRASVEEAESFGDSERAARARDEIDFIAGELARAVGLGGRDRKAASATERARINVTRRIKNALERIAESSPALGHHLESCVRTGAFCCYTPPPR